MVWATHSFFFCVPQRQLQELEHFGGICDYKIGRQKQQLVQVCIELEVQETFLRIFDVRLAKLL